MPRIERGHRQRRKTEASRRLIFRAGLVALGAAGAIGVFNYLGSMDHDTNQNKDFDNLSLENLDKLRKEFIGREIEKPSDAQTFPEEINGTVEIENIKLSLNGTPEGFDISYSPEGLKELKKAVNLENNSQFHLYTFSEDDSGDASWEPGNCKIHMPMPYIRLLAEYVLPHFPRHTWINRQKEIIQEWNNRLQAVTYHEATHAAKHFIIEDCELVDSVPPESAEKEAMIAEVELAAIKPPVFWVDLLEGQTLENNSVIRACLSYFGYN